MSAEKTKTTTSRRNFINLTSGLLLATGLSESRLLSFQKKAQADLFAPLSFEEQKKADNSELVKYIAQLRKVRLNCSENVFRLGLEYLKHPVEKANAAAAFGGGLGKRDLCGLITGASMTFGVAAASKYKDRGKMSQLAGKMNSEYWDWFKSHAPIHCRDLRKLYDGKGYHNMLKKIALKLEEILSKYKIEPKL